MDDETSRTYWIKIAYNDSEPHITWSLTVTRWPEGHQETMVTGTVREPGTVNDALELAQHEADRWARLRASQGALF